MKAFPTQTTYAAKSGLVIILLAVAGDASAQAIPKVTATATLRIPSTKDDGDVAFAYASGAVRLRSGTVGVTDGRDNRVHFFNAGGHSIASIGRAGDGPGELRANWHICESAPDTVMVLDRQLRRLYSYTARGQLFRTRSLTFEANSLTCSPGGSVAVTAMPEMKGAPINGGERIAYRATVHLYNSRSDSVGALRNVQVGEPRTLGRFTYFATSGDRIAAAFGDSAFVALLNRSGEVVGGFPAGVSGRRPTPRQYHAAAELLSAQLAVEAQRRTSVKLMLRQPMPDRLPPYSAIVSSADGGFWVAENFPGDSLQGLVRYSRTGAPVVRTSLPGHARLLSGRDDGVLAVLEDEGGDQTLTWYAVTAAGPNRGKVRRQN